MSLKDLFTLRKNTHIFTPYVSVFVCICVCVCMFLCLWGWVGVTQKHWKFARDHIIKLIVLGQIYSFNNPRTFIFYPSTAKK